MRTIAWTIALVTLCTTSAQAQERKGGRPAQTKEHGCMSMSDSTKEVLGLTLAQFAQVKESDARCLKACGQLDDGTQGKMDHTAMSAHDADMKKMMTAEQYAKWSAMCNTSRAENNALAAPQK